MTVTMPANHSLRKSGVRSGVVSAKRPATPRVAAARCGPRVDANSVVHAVLSALPELDDLGCDEVAAPVRRHGHGVEVGEPFGDVGELAASSASREAIGLDWCDAHAPSCEPRGRFDQ